MAHRIYVFGCIPPARVPRICEIMYRDGVMVEEAIFIQSVINNDIARLKETTWRETWQRLGNLRSGEEEMKPALLNIRPETMRLMLKNFKSDFSGWYLLNVGRMLSPPAFAELLRVAAPKTLNEFFAMAADNDFPHFQEAVGDGLPEKGDGQTLVLTRYIRIGGETVTCRSIFNFASRRVQETYERPALAPAMTAASFDDCNQDWIASAAEKFKSVGGDPDIGRPKPTVKTIHKKGSI